MTEFILILVAYLLGSVPFGLILARLFGGTDLRKVGSGGTGATNAGRVLGTGGFVAVWLLDMGKAMLSVWLGLMFVGDNFGAFLGLIAIIGHCFPIWLQFRGGKGVSALFGSVIMINPFIFMVSGIEWLIVATITGYSSLGAIVCFFVMGFLG
ncbi:MAG: glycerol-3-phosphate 1-O-acyltransferase PlsY, partial [Rickettsiales bacterium]|nr:glycerol-3-phosphate 1-O-acyltransferase PlsY [Rickettsiales bacterium]